MKAQEILDGFFEWLGSDDASDADQPDTRAVLQAWREMKVERARVGFQLRKALKDRRETQMRAIAEESRRVLVTEHADLMRMDMCPGERLRKRMERRVVENAGGYTVVYPERVPFKKFMGVDVPLGTDEGEAI